MADHEQVLAALSRIEESFARIKDGESESVPIDDKDPSIRVRRAPTFVYVHLPEPRKSDAARAALRDVEEWIDGMLAALPGDEHRGLRSSAHATITETRRLLADHEARSLRGVEKAEDIASLRRLIESELPRRMFDLRDCVERLNRASVVRPSVAAPAERPSEAPQSLGATPSGAATSEPEHVEPQPTSPAGGCPPRRDLASLQPDDTLTAAEIVEFFDVPRSTLQYWEESKGLECSKHSVSGRNLYRWADVKPFVDGRRGGTR